MHSTPLSEYLKGCSLQNLLPLSLQFLEFILKFMLQFLRPLSRRKFLLALRFPQFPLALPFLLPHSHTPMHSAPLSEYLKDSSLQFLLPLSLTPMHSTHLSEYLKGSSLQLLLPLSLQFPLALQFLLPISL